jgi:hypothetical protein
MQKARRAEILVAKEEEENPMTPNKCKKLASFNI